MNPVKPGASSKMNIDPCDLTIGRSLRRMKIDHRGFEAHRDLRIAAWKALIKLARHNIRSRQNGKITMDKVRDRFIVRIDSADSLAEFILQRRERTPFMNLPILRRPGIRGGAPAK